MPSRCGGSFEVMVEYNSNTLGIEGMQENVTSKVKLARHFENYIVESKRWKVFTKGELTLTTFLLHHDSLEE